jgi:hypothetical protein
MHISGDNFQFGNSRGEGSYYFSKYNHIWGWATWKRAWKHYDVNMKNFEDFLKSNQIINIFKIKQQQKYWMNIFQRVYNNKINTWDYQWAYTFFINNGFCIMPNVNLVSNIGFGVQSAHTQSENSIFSKMEAKEITEIKHPNFVLADQEADFLTSKLCFGNKNIFERVKNKMVRIISKII